MLATCRFIYKINIFIDLVPLNYAQSQLDPPFAPHTPLKSVFRYHGAGVVHLIVLGKYCIILNAR